MQQKLNYLLDRNQPFTSDKVEILDQLTNSMKVNAPDVIIFYWCTGKISTRNMESTQVRPLLLVQLKQDSAIKQGGWDKGLHTGHFVVGNQSKFFFKC